MPAASSSWNSFLAHCSFSGSNLRALAKTGRPVVSMLWEMPWRGWGWVMPVLTTSGYFWSSSRAARGREPGREEAASRLAGRCAAWSPPAGRSLIRTVAETYSSGTNFSLTTSTHSLNCLKKSMPKIGCDTAAKTNV